METAVKSLAVGALALASALFAVGGECAGAASPAPAPTVDADALVRSALDAPKRVSYVGQMQSTRFGSRTANATVQRIEHRAPDSTRRTFLAPEALYGEVDVTVGGLTTKLDPKQRRALVTETPPADSAIFATNVVLLMQNYHALAGPLENVAGRKAQTVSLVNRYTGERTMRLWIDAETRVVLAKEAYRSDGSLAWRTRYDDIRYTAAIPGNIFSTAVPPGFQETERRLADISTDFQRSLDSAGFAPVGPRYLPDGFSVVGADVAATKGVRTLHLLYSDGIRSLSLFENNANAATDFGALKPSITHFEGHDAEYVKDGPTTLLSWREHGLAFALVGDLDLKELTQIAISVVP